MTKQWMGIVAVAASAAACGGGSGDEGADPSSAVPVVVSLDTAALTQMPDSFEAGGVLVARQTAVVSSRVLAPVLRVTVQPGARVRRGQVLVELDDEAVTAGAAGARSALESARATARSAASDHTAAQAAVTLARASHERMARLHQERSATAQELDEAVAELRQAEARVAGAASNVEAANRSVDAAQANAQVAAIAQGWATLLAPFDGRVVARHVDPGTTAGPGQPLVTLESADAQTGLQMDVRLDAARAAGLAVGQVADIRVETGGASDWTPARVTKIARVDPASHSFVVTVDLPASDRWQSGYFGRARFPGPSRERLTVPHAAVVARGQLSFVYLVGADGHARLRLISIGDDRDGRVEVLAGVSAGDRVVVNPPAHLTDGAKVRQ